MAASSVLHDRVCIYTLSDPRTGHVRYVGKTKGRLRTRLAGHVGDVRRGRVYIPRHRWIAELLSVGAMPVIEEIEVCAAADWRETEQYWIAYLRFVGCELLNATAGGDGLNDFRHRPETRQKQSIAAKKRYLLDTARAATGCAVKEAHGRDDVRKNVRAAVERRKYPYPTGLVEYVRSEDGRRKTSTTHSGKVVSQATKDRIRAAAIGRLRSEESRQKQSETMRGRRHSPETIARMRETWARKRAAEGLL